MWTTRNFPANPAFSQPDADVIVLIPGLDLDAVSEEAFSFFQSETGYSSAVSDSDHILSWLTGSPTQNSLLSNLKHSLPSSNFFLFSDSQKTSKIDALPADSWVFRWNGKHFLEQNQRHVFKSSKLPSMPSSLSSTLIDNGLLVTSGSDKATYDLKRYSSLLSEVDLLNGPIFEFLNNQNVFARQQANCDVFVFVLSSLQSVAESNGRQSLEYKIAMRMLDRSLANFYSQLGTKYSNVRAQTIFSGVPAPVRVSRSVHAVAASNTTNTTTYTTNQLLDYQASLWSGAVLILVVLFTMWMFVTMNSGKEDTLLYRAVPVSRPQ